MSQLQTLGLSP